MKKWWVAALWLIAASVAQGWGQARHVALDSLNRNTREVFQESMELDSQLWDESVHLIRRPAHETISSEPGPYLVRESTWYAVGLLLRDAPGDRARASAILDMVLKQQYLSPGVPWYGTFRRTPEEPTPGAASMMWKDFDPNWREFIGTAFAVILTEYPDRIPAELAQRMYSAIDRALEGEIAEGRLLPSYSNIALMYGSLWSFAGVHDNRADWQKQSLEWMEEVHRLFKQHDAFYEYNSPTYYGVDLYGLALWRDYGVNSRVQSMGNEMEAALWKDIAAFYQPDLRNISGPYDRAYGMDMESYVSVVGVWMRMALHATAAPLPKVGVSTDHVTDVLFVPLFAILGARIPDEAFRSMTKFQGEHLLRKQITENRVATAWIGRDVVYGGETTGKTKDAGKSTQFHPATIQWRTPSREIGWIQLVSSPPLDAAADREGISISTDGDIQLRIHAKHLLASGIRADRWELPGLRVSVESDARQFHVKQDKDGLSLSYSHMTRMRWKIETARQLETKTSSLPN